MGQCIRPIHENHPKPPVIGLPMDRRFDLLQHFGPNREATGLGRRMDEEWSLEHVSLPTDLNITVVNSTRENRHEKMRGCVLEPTSLMQNCPMLASFCA